MADPNIDTALALEIVNAAMMRGGVGQAINAFDQQNNRARYANQVYEKRVRLALSEYRWEWALVQAQLARVATAPLFAWAYSYQLPTDPAFLRVHRFSPGADGLATSAALVWPRLTRADYGVRGDKLFTDHQEAWLEYVGRVSERYFSPPFVEAFELRLAAEFARSLARNDDLADQLTKELVGDPARQLVGAITRAKAVDARNSPTPGVADDAGLVSGR